ncbi:hypothetical protein F4780DRAFT_709774 [Xylariomycetidae sp. FL0641]|nr:hypothetical protein F4780DRAFT_709774 [Xylariomycetidae sp. FL0641]
MDLLAWHLTKARAREDPRSDSEPNCRSHDTTRLARIRFGVDDAMCDKRHPSLPLGRTQVLAEGDLRRAWPLETRGFFDGLGREEGGETSCRPVVLGSTDHSNGMQWMEGGRQGGRRMDALTAVTAPGLFQLLYILPHLPPKLPPLADAGAGMTSITYQVGRYLQAWFETQSRRRRRRLHCLVLRLQSQWWWWLSRPSPPEPTPIATNARDPPNPSLIPFRWPEFVARTPADVRQISTLSIGEDGWQRCQRETAALTPYPYKRRYVDGRQLNERD